MPQCLGTSASTGVRCRRLRGLDAHGYCQDHGWQRLPRCHGVKRDTGQPCRKPAKTGYAFCCSAHDPAILYIAPGVLDQEGALLRHRVQNGIVARYNSNDIYNRVPLDLTTTGALELDHIVEKQCFTSALSKMGLRQGEDNFEVATDMLRDSVVHEFDNLALTCKSTNRIKGAAVFHFLDDDRTGHRGQTTFTRYLCAEVRDGESLGRDVTRRITRNMRRSMKVCQRTLADEGETPVLEQLSGQLQQLLYVAMDLHGAH
jgi:hypothetical protein